MPLDCAVNSDVGLRMTLDVVAVSLSASFCRLYPRVDVSTHGEG
jgi:hypothetical protein